MIIGHLAVSALEHRYVKAALVPVMASAVFPDLVDKIAHYGFGQHASGRMWGHTLLGALITSAAVFILFGRHNAASWALGYLSHLVCDIGGVVPWGARPNSTPSNRARISKHVGSKSCMGGNDGLQ